MDFNDYIEETRTNARAAIVELLTYDHNMDHDDIYDSLFTDDSVTGNGSGSFTFNTYKAQENVADLIWDDDFIDVLHEYGYESVPVEQGPEALDVIARCLALSYVDIDELIEYARCTHNLWPDDSDN